MDNDQTTDGSRLWRELWRGEWTVAESRTAEGHRTLVLRRPKPGPSTRITERERVALALIVRGRPLKHIAIDLDVSLATACDIVKRALRKLGLSTRLEVAQWDFLGEIERLETLDQAETRHVA